MGHGPGCIYLPVFHLSLDTVSFSSQAEGIYCRASFQDPVEYNIKLQGGEKTCSALKSSYVKTILLFLTSFHNLATILAGPENITRHSLYMNGHLQTFSPF